MIDQRYRIQYLDSTGVLRDEGPFPLHQAELQARAAIAAGARQLVTLRDSVERDVPVYADFFAGFDDC